MVELVVFYELVGVEGGVVSFGYDNIERTLKLASRFDEFTRLLLGSRDLNIQTPAL